MSAGTYVLGDVAVNRMGYGAMQLAGPGVWGPPKDRAAAEAAAERIRHAVAARPLAVHGVEVPVTISVGIATSDDSPNAEGLLGAADAALYRAKSGGRNRVVWAGSMR